MKILNTLQKYMFTLDMMTYSPHIQEEKKIVKSENNTRKNTDIFIPKYKDTLFWCFYIIKYGWEKYHLIGRYSFSIEKKIKIEFIEYLRSKKEILKKNKWKRNYLENDLLNNDTISIETFLCLCTLHNIQATIIYDKLYYQYDNELDQKIYIIKNDKYALCTLFPNQIIKKISTFWRIPNLKKPLKSISSFKVDELKKISSKLDINISKKNNRVCTKKVIYNLIKSKLNKDFLC